MKISKERVSAALARASFRSRCRGRRRPLDLAEAPPPPLQPNPMKPSGAARARVCPFPFLPRASAAATPKGAAASRGSGSRVHARHRVPRPKRGGHDAKGNQRHVRELLPPRQVVLEEGEVARRGDYKGEEPAAERADEGDEVAKARDGHRHKRDAADDARSDEAEHVGKVGRGDILLEPLLRREVALDDLVDGDHHDGEREDEGGADREDHQGRRPVLRQVERHDVFGVRPKGDVPHQSKGDEDGRDGPYCQGEQPRELGAVRHGLLHRKDHADAFEAIHRDPKHERELCQRGDWHNVLVVLEARDVVPKDHDHPHHVAQVCGCADGRQSRQGREHREGHEEREDHKDMHCLLRASERNEIGGDEYEVGHTEPCL
mmetsp:Transcript_7975/g.19055  ORF Transcript_7975/g.19055 Transcript_7975/m.19055 type:complete len:376 (+) Transcript_7975:151-1278(+)